MSALVADVDVAAEDLRSAVTNVLQGTAVAGWHVVAKLLEVDVAVAADHVREFQHDRPRRDQRSAISSLTASCTDWMTLWVMCR
jgi:hypothetical protein